MSKEEALYEVEFYEDPDGHSPVHEWIMGLSSGDRRALGVAMYEILQFEGVDVCDSEFGKPLGEGLYEFRLRHDADEILGRKRALHKRLYPKEKVLLRVFFHPHGDRLILLVGGYDKGRFPAKRRQQNEIEAARKRLKEWQARQRA
jgi:hypothetical protein